MRKSIYVVIVIAAAVLSGCGGMDAGTFTDPRDGQTYRMAKIGKQVWFAKNLNYNAEGSRCYGEGADVEVNGVKKTLWLHEAQANCGKYGKLYYWETALTACPAGTHLPYDDDWETLINYAGGFDIAGLRLKSKRGWGRRSFSDIKENISSAFENMTDYSFSDLTGNILVWMYVLSGTDNYGFSALPGGFGYSGRFDGEGGYSDSEGVFVTAGYRGNWWSAAEARGRDARCWDLDYDREDVWMGGSNKKRLYSVRCLLDGNDASTHYSRGSAYFKNGGYDSAIAEYTEVIRLNPNYSCVYNNRGLAYFKKGDYDKAIADYNELMRQNPNNATAYNNRGYAYAKKGEYDKAIADCDEALRLHPYMAEAHDSRGYAYMGKKEYDKAIVDFEMALLFNSDLEEARENLEEAKKMKP